MEVKSPRFVGRLAPVNLFGVIQRRKFCLTTDLVNEEVYFVEPKKPLQDVLVEGMTAEQALAKFNASHPNNCTLTHMFAVISAASWGDADPPK